MTSMSNKGMTTAEFTRLLEVYGGDRTRWPAEARAAAAQLVATDVAARRLLAETEALDQVLERAPRPSLAIEAALAERIVTAAQRSPRIVRLPSAQPAAEGAAAGATSGRTLGAPARLAARLPVTGRYQPRRFGRPVAAAGVLAASLMMGILIGNASLSPQLLPALAEMAGFGSDRDDLVKIALSEEMSL